ncbi:MAG: tautomerase family protein [Schwartzia sp.]|nr:tautomerase family protein [Schwartzia sp. (in: firmicutes)]
MPCIEAKLTVTMDLGQREVLQKKLTDAAVEALGKPKKFVMVTIEEHCPLWMAGEKLTKGAYVAVRMLGDASRDACTDLTKRICAILNEAFGIEGKAVYVSFHPVETWGWDGHLF